MGATKTGETKFGAFGAEPPSFGEAHGYILTTAWPSPSTTVTLTEAEFSEIKIARSLLVDALAFEQKFELLLSNWLALEAYATSLSLSSQVERWTSYGRSSESLNGLNRHVMNLLSTARSYIDQVKGDFAAATLSPTFKDRATKALSEQYDAWFEYRFMEGLRNHVQHSSLPVHKVAPDREADAWAESMAFYALISDFEEGSHRGFKAAVWEEMRGLFEVDLRRAARSYVGSLSAVHVALREVVAQSVSGARGTFERTIDRYKAGGASSAVGLRAYAPEGLGVKPVPVLIDWDEVRITLARKNSRPISLDGIGLPRAMRPK